MFYCLTHYGTNFAKSKVWPQKHINVDTFKELTLSLTVRLEFQQLTSWTSIEKQMTMKSKVLNRSFAHWSSFNFI